jgi:hypothetical protein
MQAETSKYWDTRAGAILNLEGFKYADLHLCITGRINLCWSGLVLNGRAGSRVFSEISSTITHTAEESMSQA